MSAIGSPRTLGHSVLLGELGLVVVGPAPKTRALLSIAEEVSNYVVLVV